MKKLYIILPVAAAVLASCGVEDVYYGQVYDPDSPVDMPYEIDWNAAADSVDNVLVERFMYKDRGIFNRLSDLQDPESNYNNYWGQAHAMDVIIDAYLRIRNSSDPEDQARAAEYLNYMDLWHQNRGNNYSGPGFKNDFTDDMEWIVLTLCRMYEATEEQKYLDSAKDTYDSYIRTRVAENIAVANGTHDPNGRNGLRWYYNESRPLENDREGSTYSLNACSNGPGVLCAMRLYNLVEDQAEKEKYLADAVSVYDWLSSVLYDPATGGVSDNINNGTVGGVPLSYNQGTFMGGAHMLYTATGDPKYITEAIKAARYQMNSMTTDGVMNSETDTPDGDNALFKGIFIRYAVLLANDEAVDASFRKELKDFITYNAVVCWTQGIIKTSDDPNNPADLFFNYDWKTPYTNSTGYMQPQVSGSTLIEAMTRL